MFHILANLQTSEYIGILAACTAAFCWATTAIFFTKVSRLIGANALNGLRLLLAIFFLCICILATKGSFVIAIPIKSFCLLALSGIIGLAIGDFCYFRAFALLGPQLPVIILSVWPALAYFFSWLILGEEMTWAKTLAISLTLLCVGWVATEKNTSTETQNRAPTSLKTFGILLAIFAASAQAISYVIAKQVMIHSTKVDPLVASFVRMISAALIVWGIAIWRGQTSVWFQSLHKNRLAFRYLILGSFLGAFLGVWLSLIAANSIPIGLAATLISTVPIWVMFIFAFVYKEIPTFRATLGTLGAILGITILMFL